MTGLHNDTNQLLRALYGDFVRATVGCNGKFGLCIFGSPYNLGQKELLCICSKVFVKVPVE